MLKNWATQLRQKTASDSPLAKRVQKSLTTTVIPMTRVQHGHREIAGANIVAELQRFTAVITQNSGLTG
jgi:hypothetical protein